MIVGFFFSIAASLVMFFVNLLPVYAIPQGWFDAVNFIWGMLNALNFLLPVATLLQVLGIAIFVHVSVLLWHLALKIYHMLPVIGH